MKRDLDLIRKMVLEVEGAPSGYAPDLTFNGYTEEQVAYHSYLLIDAGLARGADVTTMASDGPAAIVQSLTWEGHEFAEAARDEKRWKRAMGVVAERGGNVTLDVMKDLLVSLMRGAFGLG